MHVIEEGMQYQKAIDYICKRLELELPVVYKYHNINHTTDVLSACDRLAKIEELSQLDRQLLRTAAAYHDAGFLDTYDGHEERSIEIIGQFLPGFGYSDGEIEQISTMVKATVLPQKAQDYLSMLLCDADLDYLGRSDFDHISSLLREEWAQQRQSYTEKEWYTLQVEFLKHHVYYSKAARVLRQPGLERNLSRMESRLAEITRSS